MRAGAGVHQVVDGLGDGALGNVFAIQRITAENKQRVRQLTTDNRTLEERLKAARSNLRFQDHRVAGLEAQLVDPTAITRPRRSISSEPAAWPPDPAARPCRRTTGSRHERAFGGRVLSGMTGRS
ncbi:hypothetical protein [Streptomyces sp. NPDC005209]|uniref:hypothetical protein n=1 Tax=Streptomyces sp. NPDC005209 TaxID=3156715 RepID=UPI0033AB587C